MDIKKIKSIKLKNTLGILIPTCTLAVAAGAIPIAVAVMQKMPKAVIELSSDTSTDVKIKESNIVKGKLSTVTLDIPSGKEIVTIEVKIGDEVLTKDIDYTIDSNNKITIKADVVDGNTITVKAITKDIKVASVKITNSETQVTIGNPLVLTTEILPENALNRNIEWSITSKGGQAHVDESIPNSPKLVGDSAGKVIVKAAAKDGSGKTDSKEITIVPEVIKVTSVKITNTETEVIIGTPLALTAEVLPTDATNKSLEWTVTSSGGTAFIDDSTPDSPKLVGDTDGKVTVIATAKDGSAKTNSKEFEIKSPAKNATLIYDQTSWNDAGVTFSGLKTESISDESAEASKISFTCNATGAAKKGVVQIYDENDVLIEDLDLASIETTTTTLNLSFTKWDLVESGSELTVKFNRSYFNNKSWITVSDACDAFEAISAPTIEDAMTLCVALGISAPIEGTDAKETLQKNLVGVEGVILINNQIHKVKCIDAMHADDKIVSEEIVTTTPATLTFEMFTVLSDSDGYEMRTKWDSSNNRNYIDSVLRKALTGQGNASALQWYKYDGTTKLSEARTAFEMLPSDLQSVIKTVNKKVATKTGSATEYSIADCNDKLFLLTYTEMAQTSSLLEGSAYKYWTDHNNNEARKKQDAIISPFTPFYWIGSPYTSSSDIAWSVKRDGSFYSFYEVDSASPVSFAFCI